MRALLQLQHHKHTAKRLPHHHTSYRGLLLIVIAVGLSMTLINKASAEIIDVSARIAAPVPTQSPQIVSPATGVVVTNPTIDIAGTCQVLSPTYAVTIWRGSQFLGSSDCKADGTFVVTVSLQAGPNSLYAGSYTITGDKGPDGQPIDVIYNPATTTTQPIPATSPNKPVMTPTPIVPIDLVFGPGVLIIYTPNKPAILDFEITGGDAPYQVTINWGDGTRSTQATFQNSGKQALEHTYSSTKPHTITVTVTDKNGQSRRMTIATLTFAQTIAPSSVNTSTPFSSYPNRFNLYVWSAYGTVVLLLVSVWFGEVHIRSNTIPARVRPSSARKVKH